MTSFPVIFIMSSMLSLFAVTAVTAMASVHVMTEEVHGDEQNEEEEKN